MAKIKLHSLILKYFNEDVCLSLLKVTMIPEFSNNDKGTLIKEILRERNIPFSPLGSGTNRMGILIDGYAVKIALDKDGMIDNKREFLYTKTLQPYVVKVYESTSDGLIAVTEYVDIFTLSEFKKFAPKMREILKDISKRFLIGDVGVTTKNYVNWGTRADGTICILDFAYIYDIKYKIFTCSHDGELLVYDKNYVQLICPECGRKYDFGQIRRRITRKQQESEIGDIMEIGYNLHHDNEVTDIIPKFEPIKKKSNTDDPYKKIIKEYRKGLVDRNGNKVKGGNENAKN